MTQIESAKPSLIKNFEIKGLFDQFTYRLSTQASESADCSLFLLYGDNGAGKSTILSLVFHLLHPEPFGGHRTFVSQIPFHSLHIELTSGLILLARKESPFSQDAYCIRLTGTSSGKDINWKWTSDRKAAKDEVAYGEYCSELEKAGIAFHFLSDSRKVVGLEEERRRRLLKSRGGRLEHEDFRLLMELEERGHPTTEFLVKDAVDRTIQWFQQQALSGTAVGYTSVNTIYSDLIRRFVAPGEASGYTDTDSTEELRKRLSALTERNSRFSNYGLTPELETSTIDGLLQRASPNQVEVLNTILQPYLDGHSARLDALQEVQEIIDDFASMLSEFFARKKIFLDVRRALEIVTPKGQPDYQ